MVSFAPRNLLLKDSKAVALTTGLCTGSNGRPLKQLVGSRRGRPQSPPRPCPDPRDSSYFDFVREAITDIRSF